MILVSINNDSIPSGIIPSSTSSISLQQEQANHLDSSKWLPVVQEFQRLIESNEDLLHGFTQMFEQGAAVAGGSNAKNYKEMLQSINGGIQQAPRYRRIIYVGCHLYHVLDKVMCTPIGLATLANPLVNAQFKRVFDVWAAFLSSPESRSVLTTDEDGWFGPMARVDMPDFFSTFPYDPQDPYGGYQSWDDFFTRPLRPGVRPVEHPEDDSIINSACESTVYSTAYGIKERDNFWLKGQPYSLRDMFNDDLFVNQFVGGTILQCFLAATSYHRWHSPINGTVVKTRMIPGVYYTQAPSTPDDSQMNPVLSQGYLTAVSSRALMFIESDNPRIGLMCLMAVGMIDVSTCDIRVKEGDRITKGQEMGMFHFGGSTYCMVFRPGVEVDFSCTQGDSVPVNSAIASVSV